MSRRGAGGVLGAAIAACVAAGIVGAASPGQGADGVIELSHARALAGDPGAGDAPGYPIDLNRFGSYVLTSNLLSPDQNTSVLRLNVSGIQVDLNGFMIRGVTSCSVGASGVSCSPNDGINFLVAAGSGVADVTLLNGTVAYGGSRGADLGARAHVRGVRFLSNRLGGLRTGLSSSVADSTASENGGIGFLIGSSSRISAVVATANGGDGIDAGTATTVLDSTSNANFGYGIDGDQLTISRNTVNGNQLGGIILTTQGTVSGSSIVGNATFGIACLGNATRGCTVVDNTINANAGTGLAFNGGAAYQGNTINGNGATVLNGVQTGGNVCDGDSVCP